MSQTMPGHPGQAPDTVTPGGPPHPASPQAETRARVPGTGRGQGRLALLFLLPMLVMYAIYFGYSFYFVVSTSFQKVGLGFFDATTVGLKNYQLLAEDPAFRRAILNNIVFALCSIGVAVTIGFFIAVVLATGVRGRRLYYVIFLVPALMPVALVSTIFGSMLTFESGALNTTLRSVGLGSLSQHWLTNSSWAMASVIGLFAYMIGLPIMYYTADLSAMRTDALEAAVLDGAGAFTIMRSIVHPMLRSTHITVVLALLLGSFRAFEVVLLSTGGGPGYSTEIAGTYIYQYATSSGSTVGYASAASTIVLLIALLVSAVQAFMTRRSER